MLYVLFVDDGADACRLYARPRSPSRPQSAEEAPHISQSTMLDEPACSQSSLSRRAHNDDRALPALSADRVLAVFCTIWSMVQEMMRIGLL